MVLSCHFLQAGVADALLLTVNTTGPPTAPHHTLVVRGSRFQEITVDSFYGVKGERQGPGKRVPVT